MTITTGSILDFTRALWRDWLTRMSGPLSVPLAVAAYIVPNDIAKILLGLTAFICVWATAYVLWQQEHDKVVERDANKRQLLDRISALRERIVEYRIEIERAYGFGGAGANQFDEAEWERRYGDLQNEIAARIEQLSSKAEASAYLHRGNISRTYRPGREGAFRWPLARDVAVHDIEYLRTFIHAYSPDRRQTI